MRKKSLILFLILILSVFAVSHLTHAEILDRIVASVNGEIITMRDINNRVEIMAKANNVTNPSDIDALKRRVLEGLIDKILVLQEGKRQKLEVTDKDVDAAILRIKQSGNMTEDAFKMELAKQGLTYDTFRDDLRADILKSRLVKWDIQAHIVVTDAEIDSYLGTSGGGQTTDEKPAVRLLPSGSTGSLVRVRNILIPLPEQPSEDSVNAVKAFLAKIMNELKNGRSFTDVAAEYSEAPNAKQGGDLGAISLADIDPSIRSALEPLKEGEYTAPIQTGAAVQIFQLVERQNAGSVKDTAPEATPEQRATNQQRERARQELSDKKLQQKYLEWMMSLREKAMININF
jgi:peptidyl-prolyl cis-trans isomerase SurA